MADENTNTTADINEQLKKLASSGNSEDQIKRILSHLENLNKSIDSIGRSINNSRGLSQSAARDSKFQSAYNQRRNTTFRNQGRRSKFVDGPSLSDGFFDNFEEELLKGLFGSDFRKHIQRSFEDLAKELNVSMQDIPGKFGKSVGSSVKSLGKSLLGEWSGKVEKGSTAKKAAEYIQTASGTGAKVLGKVAEYAGEGSRLGALATKGSTAITAAGAKAGGIASKAAGFAAANPAAAAAIVIGTVVAFKQLGPAIQGVKSLIEGLKKSANRYQKSRDENLKYAQKRLEQDVESMVRYPFDILKKAAEELYQSWSSNIGMINQTQGYTKNDTMSLMSSLASRLREEGLSDVIAGTDLVSALSNVLQSGLSGQIAEEFAYQALKMNKAVPTYDFFGFASTYASVAANAVKSGLSQNAAIQEANKSLEEFTSSILYANRELTGGFTTGLQDANSLYQQAAKIAQAARSNNITGIGSTLTSVAAVTGAIAPDLVSSMTDALYRAATGGNSSDIVALRSLAGINASNTEFLRAFANDPKGIITTMFQQLGYMFNQSPDAYMEKAEGYAQLFGLSSEAFQRIDFNYLAQQISKMNENSGSLDNNLELLKSGQSTATAEQLKIAEINKLMIDEGLAYVIDNEAAQMIQEHMWEEQMNRELMEATYAVDLQGDAAKFIEGIKNTVANILNFLNPLSFFKKIGNVINTANERRAQNADLRKVLELGKVGTGRAQDLINLTTRNRNLHLMPTLVEMMGGRSSYAAARQSTRAWNVVSNPFLAGMDAIGTGRSRLSGLIHHAAGGGSTGGGVASQYSWGGLSKSAASGVAAALAGTGSANIQASNVVKTSANATEQSVEKMKARIEQMVGTIKDFVKEGKSYDEWVQSASNYGISDFGKAVTEVGYNETQFENQFQNEETQQGVEEAHRLKLLEERMYNESHTFWTEEFWARYNDPLTENLLAVQDKQDILNKMFDKYAETFDKFREKWDERWKQYASYYLYHNVYSGEQLQLKELQKVQNKEKSEKGDVVNKLSEMLTANNWDLDDLKDPQIQANALLSQILVVVNAIMNQNNEKNGTISLADSIAALATGTTT